MTELERLEQLRGQAEAELILHAQEPTVSPELMMAALGQDAPEYFRFTRLEAYREDMTPFR